MTLPPRLTAAGWVFHGEGCWTLTRAGHVALKAQDLFDGKWLIYEDQGDTEGPSRWGEPVRSVDEAGLLGVVDPIERLKGLLADEGPFTDGRCQVYGDNELDGAAVFGGDGQPFCLIDADTVIGGDPLPRAQMICEALNLLAALSLPLPSVEIRREAEAVEDYVCGYEYRCDDGQGYTPTEADRGMLADAIHGFLTDREATR